MGDVEKVQLHFIAPFLKYPLSKTLKVTRTKYFNKLLPEIWIHNLNITEKFSKWVDLKLLFFFFARSSSQNTWNIWSRLLHKALTLPHFTKTHSAQHIERPETRTETHANAFLLAFPVWREDINSFLLPSPPWNSFKFSSFSFLPLSHFHRFSVCSLSLSFSLSFSLLSSPLLFCYKLTVMKCNGRLGDIKSLN